MKVVIQRVLKSSVTIEGKKVTSIGKGLLVFLGIVNDDTQDDIDWLCNKIVNLRIFGDENGVMNKSLQDVGGELILVSQFTLHAATKKETALVTLKQQNQKSPYPYIKHVLKH